MKPIPLLLIGLICMNVSVHAQFPTNSSGDTTNKLTNPTLEWSLNNPDQITPDILRDTNNIQILNEFKRLALTKPNSLTVVPLLQMRDPEVTKEIVKLYMNRDMNSSPDINLMDSKNPDIIALIGDDVNRNEVPDTGSLQGWRFIEPYSIVSADIITAIIRTSPEFSPEVKSWASSLPGPSGELRQRVRKWWNQNKEFLKAKQYAQVTPPE